MAIVTAPRNGIPIGLATIAGQRVMVEVHPEYLRWFESLTGRVGGVTGPSTTELAMSQFEDAGIEELKATVYALADEVRSLPPVVQLPQVAATGGGGNSVAVSVDFGASFTDKAQTVVTGQAWVATGSEIVAQVLTTSGTDPDEMRLLDMRVVISDIVAGNGFTVTVYSETEARGVYTVACIGV